MHIVVQVNNILIYYASYVVCLLGVYQLMASNGVGRPATQYSGMSINVSRRVNEHDRGGLDNIALQMNQAANRGMDVRVRYAQANSPFEARAQELYLLNQRDYAWNSRNNGGNVSFLVAIKPRPMDFIYCTQLSITIFSIKIFSSLSSFIHIKKSVCLFVRYAFSPCKR